jgi:hypothetical protein
VARLNVGYTAPTTSFIVKSSLVLIYDFAFARPGLARTNLHIAVNGSAALSAFAMQCPIE